MLKRDLHTRPTKEIKETGLLYTIEMRVTDEIGIYKRN